MNLPPDILQELISETRLNIVRSTMLFGTDPEVAFDRIAAMASLALASPVSQVTLLGKETQWFKASLGVDLKENSVETSFCNYTLRHGGENVVSLDTTLDDRFMDNPFVKEEPHIRFYAGSPIFLDKQVIGTVCVYDFEPKDELAEPAMKSLEYLAEITSELIAARRKFESK